MYDVIVVGGGIVGMSTAYHLVCAGAKTLLIDREDRGRATDAGAGILSPETNSRDPGYARCGQIVVAVSEDEFALFDHARSLVLGRQERRGLPSIDDLYEISGSEARELFPPLASVYGDRYYRNAARVDGRLLNRALRQAAQQRGLVIQQGSVERLVIQNGAVTGVVVAGATLSAGTVVIAGGA